MTKENGDFANMYQKCCFTGKRVYLIKVSRLEPTKNSSLSSDKVCQSLHSTIVM
uniref:Uncharacterized protein n=1 Tax=Rhizophora mucronata TaxID=61149 RepID=A0A2P2JTC9_RHIMU